MLPHYKLHLNNQNHALYCSSPKIVPPYLVIHRDGVHDWLTQEYTITWLTKHPKSESVTSLYYTPDKREHRTKFILSFMITGFIFWGFNFVDLDYFLSKSARNQQQHWINNWILKTGKFIALSCLCTYVYVWIICCKDLFRRISEKMVTIETCLRKHRRKPDCFLFQNMLKSEYCNI